MPLTLSTNVSIAISSDPKRSRNLSDILCTHRFSYFGFMPSADITLFANSTALNLSN